VAADARPSIPACCCDGCSHCFSHGMLLRMNNTYVPLTFFWRSASPLRMEPTLGLEMTAGPQEILKQEVLGRTGLQLTQRSSSFLGSDNVSATPSLHLIHDASYPMKMSSIATKFSATLAGGDGEAAALSVFIVFVMSVIVVLTSCCCAQRARSPPRDMDEADVWTRRNVLIECLSQGLEEEGYADFGCCGLLLNRPWLSTARNVVVPELTPNWDWMDGMHFPNGETRTDNVAAMVLATWVFLFRKKRPYSSVFLMVLVGIGPAITSQLLGSIVDQIQQGHSPSALLIYCCALFAVQLIQDRAFYLYELIVPLASVRHELRHRLQWAFLSMEFEAASVWPSGRCAAVLENDVNQMVNLTWGSLFVLTQHTATILGLIGLILYTNRDDHMLGFACLAMFVVLLAGSCANVRVRQANCMDLATRKRDWELAWVALATRQIREQREGSELRNPQEAAKVLSSAAFVYRKRAFHYYFIRLVASLSSSEMALLAQAAVAFIAGWEAMRGYLTVGQALALVTGLKTFSAALKDFVTLLLNILEGSAHLLNIVTVFNRSEIRNFA